MTDRTYAPKQRAKPLDDLLREFLATGRGSSGVIRTATAATDATGATTVLDLDVPAGVLWKLLRVTVSGQADLEYELLVGPEGAEEARLRGDAKGWTPVSTPLEGLPAEGKEKVLVKAEPAGGGTARVKATLHYEELT